MYNKTAAEKANIIPFLRNQNKKKNSYKISGRCESIFNVLL